MESTNILVNSKVNGSSISPHQNVMLLVLTNHLKTVSILRSKLSLSKPARNNQLPLTVHQVRLPSIHHTSPYIGVHCTHSGYKLNQTASTCLPPQTVNTQFIHYSLSKFKANSCLHTTVRSLSLDAPNRKHNLANHLYHCCDLSIHNFISDIKFQVNTVFIHDICKNSFQEQ